MDFYGQPPKPPSHIEASPDESELWKFLYNKHLPLILRKKLNKNTSSSSSKGSFIIVEIGITLKKYLLPRATLSYYSEYFQKALSGPWKEAEEGFIRLDDVEISTCKWCLHSADLFNFVHNIIFTGFHSPHNTTSQPLRALDVPRGDTLCAEGHRVGADPLPREQDDKRNDSSATRDMHQGVRSRRSSHLPQFPTTR